MPRENHLFVYGTLMIECGSAMSSFLAARGTHLGRGRVSGRLLDLGRYPGLVLQPGSEDTVTGDIFLLREAEKTLATLDAYEGIDPKRPDEAEYRRAMGEVTGPQGSLRCWMYLFQGETATFPVIPGGYYPAFARSAPAHRAFLRH